MTKKQGLTGLLLSVFVLCSMGSHVLAAPDAQIYPPQALPGEHPELSIEFNVVRDARGKKTGFVELALFAQTPENKAFTMFSTSLEYNSDVLQPVSWTLTPGESGKLTPDQLSADAAALGLNGENVYCGDLPVKGDDNTDGGTAQGGGLPYDGTLLDGTQAPFNALYFSAESRNITGVRYPEPTALAVIRMYDTTGKFDTAGPSDAPEVTYDGTPVTSDNVTDFVRFTDDARAKSSPAKQSAWYASADSEFYYVASYNGDPNTLVDVTLNDVQLSAPDTIGRRVLAVDETKTPAEEGYYSYRTNLLDAVPFKVTSKLSYDSGGGTDIGNLATILFYDWDDTLLGTLTVEKGDARAEVNAYVEEHFIHPDLRASTHTGADYTDSTARRYTYRDETYPAEGPGGTIKTPATGDMAGDEYQLTNKLDYSFYKRVTTKTIDDSYPDPDDPSATITATVWTTYPVSEAANAADTDLAIPADAEKYPYVNGWARVTDIKRIEDVWTTFGTQGELKNCDPATGEYITYDDSAYFDLVDFSDLEAGVYYVKACYEEGAQIDRANFYTIISPVQYRRANTYGSTQDGTAYTISYQYGRVYEGYGVLRTREPSVRISYVPDQDGVDGKSFYMKGVVSNTDTIDVEFTPSANIRSLTYMLGDSYGQNSYATGIQRSDDMNEGNIPVNFDLNNFNYEERFGTDGFVYQATLNQLLETATNVVQNGKKAEDVANLNTFLTVATFKDLNIRLTDTVEVNNTYLSAAQERFLDAVDRAYDSGAIDSNGVVELEWHQIQYHFVNYSTGGIGSGPILSPSECGGFAWCRQDDCGKYITVTINNFNDLLVAMMRAEDPLDIGREAAKKAIDDLSLIKIQSYNFRQTSDGVPYTNKDVFLVDMEQALKELKEAGFNKETLSKVTWLELQYLLHGNSYLSNDILAGLALDYWWRDGEGKTIETLQELLDAAYLVYVDKTVPDALKGVTDATLAAVITDAPMWLRADNNGIPYANSDALKSALEPALIALTRPKDASGGGYDRTTLITADWREIQYALINGDYKSLSDILTDPAIDFWWQGGGKPKLTWDKFLPALENFYLAGGMDLDDLLTDVDVINNQIYLRKNSNGGKFVSVSEFKSVVTDALNNISFLTPNGEDFVGASSLNFTWYELQYLLLHYQAFDGITAMPDDAAISTGEGVDYWWKAGGTPPQGPIDINSISDLLTAAQWVKDDENGQALDGLSLSGVANLRLRASSGGVTFTDVETSFKPALMSALNILTTAPAPYTGDNVSGASWEELQYALINQAYKSKGEILSDSNINYWWKGDAGVPASTLKELLRAAYLAYCGDDSGVAGVVPDALDNLDLELVSESPMWLRPQDDGETRFANGVAFRTALEPAIRSLMMDGNYRLDTISEASWEELQYALINGNYKSREDQATEGIVYWWKDGHSKPDGGDEKTEIEVPKWDEFMAALTKYWCLTGDPADVWAVVADVDVLNDELLLRKDLVGTKFASLDELLDGYGSGHLDNALTALDGMSNGSEFISYEEGAERVSLTWWQMQYLLLNYESISALPTETEIKASESYEWKFQAGGGDEKTEIEVPKWDGFMAALTKYWCLTGDPADVWAVVADVDVLNDELLLRKDLAGTKFASLDELLDGYGSGHLDNALTALDGMSNGSEFISYEEGAERVSLTWWQMQYLLLNYESISALPTETEIKASEDYGWKFIGGKYLSQGLDLSLIELESIEILEGQEKQAASESLNEMEPEVDEIGPEDLDLPICPTEPDLPEKMEPPTNQELPNDQLLDVDGTKPIGPDQEDLIYPIPLPQDGTEKAENEIGAGDDLKLNEGYDSSHETEDEELDNLSEIISGMYPSSNDEINLTGGRSDIILSSESEQKAQERRRRKQTIQIKDDESVDDTTTVKRRHIPISAISRRRQLPI